MERWEKSPSVVPTRDDVVPTRDDLVTRLRARFAGISAESVRRCVDDLWCCCTHIGVRPEERTIERLAASRLTGVERGARLPHPDGEPVSGSPVSTAPGKRPPGVAAAPPLPPRTRTDLTAPPRTARAAARTSIGM
ncbi:hypothetical protein [Actinomadura algeriensis]|uniref:Uncharacterized protein n=1 Tax=Actinomadura algeriensis TaxID=1679523 RepID=A0ABR9K2Y5_9ACTN|nr:hypothetical protein [Actinomadura algeriensis]MBE1537216.1 hypothetical protein [Actinomadura algeriensis]